MTLSDMVEELEITSGETDVQILSIYLNRAGDKLCRMLKWEEVPEAYGHLQVEVAEYMLNKRGAEGELSHNENGVNRSYENADIPASLLRSYGIVGTAEVIS